MLKTMTEIAQDREVLRNHKYAELTNKILIAYKLGNLRTAKMLERERDEFTRKTGYKV